MNLVRKTLCQKIIFFDEEFWANEFGRWNRCWTQHRSYRPLVEFTGLDRVKPLASTGDAQWWRWCRWWYDDNDDDDDGQSKATQCAYRWYTMVECLDHVDVGCWKYVDFLQVSCETDNWGKDPPGTQLDPHCNIVRIHHVAWSKCIVTALNHQNIHKLTHIWCIGRLSYSRRKSTNAIVFAMHSVHSQYWKVIIECIVEVDIHSY